MQDVSIIIPTYNEEKYLPKLLHCLGLQTLQPKEIIVADAHSQDKTRRIADKFGCIVVAGGTPAVGRNNGAKKANGDILLFLDADVVLADDFLEKTVNEMAKRKLDVASCLIQLSSKQKSFRFLEKIYNYFSLTMEQVYPHAGGFCIFIKRDLHKKIRGFNKKILMLEDCDYVLRASKVGKFRFLKSSRFFLSTRRFVKNGKFKTSFQVITMELHYLLLGGIEKNIYNYEFGEHVDDTPELPHYVN